MPLTPVTSKVIGLLAIYALCMIAGFVCSWVGLPLPWMIGPLWMTAALSLSGLNKRPMPVQTRPFGQMVVASSVGLAFTAEAFGMVLDRLPLLVGLALLTASLAFSLALVQARISGARLSRMVLATFPIAPVEAAVLAEQSGVPAAPVVVAQTLRIAAIVVVVPLLLYAINGQTAPVSGRVGAGWDHPAGLAILIVLAAGAGRVFDRLGWANPYFLGPLGLIAVLSAVGLGLPPYPAPVLAGAQVLLGAWLGSTFQPALFRGAGRELAISLIGTLMMLPLIAVGAALIAMLTGLEWETLLLSAAPGGVTEMALTAQYLQQDIALVTAAHLVRIFLLMPMARPMIRFISRNGG